MSVAIFRFDTSLNINADSCVPFNNFATTGNGYYSNYYTDASISSSVVAMTIADQNVQNNANSFPLTDGYGVQLWSMSFRTNGD